MASGTAETVETPLPAAEEPVAILVQLSSGRSFLAELDQRTDANLLWLRFHRDGVELLRPIEWSHVDCVELAGQRIPGSELQRAVELIRMEVPVQPIGRASDADIELVGCAKPAPDSPPAQQRRIVSLQIEVRVGRWDENVEPNGLVVNVQPVDAHGEIVPVRATLNVDLRIQQRNTPTGRSPFIIAGQWSETVRESDFGPTGATYKLRFQGIHPEFSAGVRGPGLVHAVLTVPGQGVFEASESLRFIRPFNPARDTLQSATRHGYFPGYRYFPNERTGEGRR